MDEIQAQFTAWVNDVVQKTDEFVLGTMERYLTEKGYADIFEINGANLIAAIEKQIPKKPFYCKDIPHCSKCKYDINAGADYCRKCGQAIDWGE